MIISNLDKFRRLSRAERNVLFKSVFLLPLIHCGLRYLGYHRLRRILELMFSPRISGLLLSETDILARGWEIARIIAVASEHGFYKATCLRRSLLVWAFLRREGIPSRICFGIRKVHGKLEAHAWVEHNDTVINDAATIRESFQSLADVLPSAIAGL